MIRLFFCFSLLWFSSIMFAQNGLGSWGMYFGDASLPNTAFKLNYEVQHRNFKIHSDLNQLLLRGSIQYTGIENLNLALGYAHVSTEKRNTPNLPFYENRIYQEISTQQKFNIVKVKHRFRFEQRFFDNQDFRTRFRYNLGIDVPWTQTDNGKSFYTTVYNELFINTNKTQTAPSVFDRNRLSLGKGFRFNKSLAIQAAWMTQLFEKGNEQQITLSLHHSI